MIQTPPPPPTVPHQPALTTAELALKDSLRALGFNLRLGAHWLVDDVGPRLAQQFDPAGVRGKRERWHLLVDSAAKGTLSTLEDVQHRAASKALADAPYRTLDFELLPLAGYLSSGDERNPSGLFAEVFYWLIRHALAMEPGAGKGWLVRQLAVDAAYWRVQAGHDEAAPLAAETATDTDLQHAERHAMACARLLLALIASHPVRDATLLPWMQDADGPGEPPGLLRVLLGVVLAAGSVTPASGNDARAAACLRLGRQIASARHDAFERAIHRATTDGAASLAAEFAFVLRHL